MKKRGFTLIELLAVIVVLSIILVIAIPSISNILNVSSKSAFESDAKLVLKAAEYKTLENSSFNPTDVNNDNISNLLGLSNQNYDNIKITTIKDIYAITIIGTGKWNGLIACGSFENMRVVDNTNDCNGDLIPPVITILGGNPIDILIGQTYIDAGSSAIDDIDGDITSIIQVTSDLNSNVSGSYTVTYTVKDISGNIAVLSRVVNVIDNVGPIITFGTNENSTYTKSSETTVNITDVGGIDTSSLKYLWSTSTTTPNETAFTTSFTNGGTITSPDGVTGSYYLWILAKDKSSNTTITNSNVFNLDNAPPIINLIGSTPITIDQYSTYTDTGSSAIDDIDGNITNRIQVTSDLNTNLAGSYTITYNVVDTAGNTATTVTRTITVKFVDLRYNASKGVNGPALTTGMTPIKWNGTSWIDTTTADSDWYNYTAIDKKWANARTADGSMWVWIPRYIYKISSGWHTSTVGTINIQFSKGVDDNWNSSVIGNIDTGTTSNASNNKWTNHPAFTFGSTELIGIWVAKFEASGTTSAVKFIPTVTSLRNQLIGTFFNAPVIWKLIQCMVGERLEQG